MKKDLIGYYYERGYIIVERDHYGQDARIVYRSSWEIIRDKPELALDTIRQWCDQTGWAIIAANPKLYGHFIDAFYDNSRLI